MKSTVSKLIIVVKVISQMVFFYGLLGWLYGVAIQLTNPELLPYPMSHLILWLRVDTFTIMSFVMSAVGFFVWRSVKELADYKTP